MKKKISIFILCIIIISLICVPIYADIYDTKYQASVNGNLVGVWDNADLFTDSEESELFDLAKQYSEKCNITVIFLTVNNAKGKTTMVYTDDFYDHLVYDSGHTYNYSSHSKWGNDNPGVLFAIDMDNRESYINTSGDVIDWFSDREIDNCLSKGDSYLGNGQYFKAIKAIAKSSIDNIYNWKSKGYTGEESSSSGGSTKVVSTKKLGAVISERIGMSIFIGLIIAVIASVKAYKKENKANVPISSSEYVQSNEFRVLNRQEQYVRTYETVSKGYYRPSSSSSGHSSGSSHSSSGGHSHGGGGHHF